MCYKGPTCEFLHRLPTSSDEAAAKHSMADIFGREKLPDWADKRGGAGSYERDMRVLYINYGGAGQYAAAQLHKLLRQDFGVWGPIQRINIVPAKAIAFVAFHWRVSAEFAHEAMDGQQLSGSSLKEVRPGVRWPAGAACRGLRGLEPGPAVAGGSPARAACSGPDACHC